MTDQEHLRQAFFARIPKARPASPIFQKLFEFFYQAHLAAKPGTKLLNIYSAKDFSGNREEVYREEFFKDTEYRGVDFWADKFVIENEAPGAEHTLPFGDHQFDLLVTTKVIMEHISEPSKALSEFHRVLKPGGEAFVIAPLVRRQHQAPYDYFRYTEYGLQYLFKKAGFQDIQLTHTNGWAVTATSYAYFFQRGLGAPKWLEKCFDWIYYWIVEPLGFFLDKFDNGYGRDLTLYFLVRAKA